MTPTWKLNKPSDSKVDHKLLKIIKENGIKTAEIVYAQITGMDREDAAKYVRGLIDREVRNESRVTKTT